MHTTIIHSLTYTHTHTHHLTETDTWSKHTTSGPPPQALSMSGIISDDKLVTFGGVLSGKGCNSVNILDISESPYSRIVKNQSERDGESMGRDKTACIM